MKRAPAVGQKLLLAFRGKDSLPAEIRKAIRRYRPSGFTLFRSFNIGQPAQVRALTTLLQQAAQEEGLPPFLIAADQEGGQLMAVSDGATQLPGNMALGACASPDLARQAGQVLGLEMAALGFNVNYAPSCDVNINPFNPVIGTRSFGEDPQQVARLAAALVEGMQASGVAATAKHFPGHGDTDSDSHHGVPRVAHALERLRQVELPPFKAAIGSGVKLVMTAHLALPALEGGQDVPATLSRRILTGLLRQELGFEGVIVTDAMDMKAIRQGAGLGEEAVRAAAAGADLLLLTDDPADHERVFESLAGASRGQAGAGAALDPAELQASLARIAALKQWLAAGRAQPDLSLVGCAAHRAVAEAIAARSITLVRDLAGRLPLLPQDYPRLAAIVPQPLDLTPADTSSYVHPGLAQALRGCYPQVDEFSVGHAPTSAEISGIVAQLQSSPGYDAVILGTINAYAQPAQAALVQAVLQTGRPVVIVALRMPYDLTVFPQAPTYFCTYSLLEPSMDALARVLCGDAQPQGRLPVSIPDLYPRNTAW